MRCCDYHAGMLKTLVEFQRVGKTGDGAGGFTDASAPLSGAPTRAHIKALSGGERYASERVEATAKLRVTVRYFDGLTESDVIVFSGKRHNIRFINNVELQNRWFVIDVDAGVAPE